MVTLYALEQWIHRKYAVSVNLRNAKQALMAIHSPDTGVSHPLRTIWAIADFANLLGQIPDGFGLIEKLYGRPNPDAAFVQGYFSFQEGVRLEQIIREMWRQEGSLPAAAERALLRFLASHPNYVLNNLRLWTRLPEDFLIRKQRIFDALVGSSGRLLDVGCSYNPWVASYSAWDHFVGVDLSLMSLRAGRLIHAANRGHLVNSNAESLPFRDASFDAVVSSEVLEHSSHPDSFIREISRILRQSGIAVLSVPMHVVDKIDLGMEGDPTHRGDFYSFEALCKVFNASGFILEDMKKDPYYIFKLRKIAG